MSVKGCGQPTLKPLGAFHRLEVLALGFNLFVRQLLRADSRGTLYIAHSKTCKISSTNLSTPTSDVDASLSAKVGENSRTSSKFTSCQIGRITLLPPTSRVARPLSSCRESNRDFLLLASDLCRWVECPALARVRRAETRSDPLGRGLR